MPDPVEVAVAVFERPDGTVLLARRPQGKVYAGYWEFPGGKVEPGEPVDGALRRGIREELGVEIVRQYPWITRSFSYPHANVRLHFHRVAAWCGELHALEHEALAWQQPDAVGVEPLLPANGPVLRSLQLPDEYAISDAAGMGVERFLARLEARLLRGLKLVQLREKSLGPRELKDLACRTVALAHARGARVLVNGDTALARESGADGVHLTASQLRAVPVRPDSGWCGASCHSAEELRLAESLGADFAVLGPVRATPTHPDSPPIGWEGFGRLVAGAGIPVYALGGMSALDLEQARTCGAHGVAMVRGAWEEGRG